ncbi:hypothetical protein PIROE2DRAFT_12272 [Piromyces sp. E2]|nr:hypothetical protein PIROE2DRAFT_12272 [Piromyces sp. E2]|eukprot:OUM61677.1 hypothetical protein PIROE2DRAFT_12272 [Piromyces sp. E2]
MIEHFSIFLIFFITLSFIRVIYNKSIIISNENDFKKALNSHYSNIVLNSSISIEENYKLNSNIDEIKITGITKDIILNFKNEEDGLNIENCMNFEINNLTFTGNLFISKCSNTSLSNIDFNGLIQSSFSNIILQNFKYNNFQKQKSQYGIFLNNVSLNITNSSFYGSSSITNNILYITSSGVNLTLNSTMNENSSILNINDSYFSGEYKCGILKTYSTYLMLINSKLEKGLTYDNGAVLNSEFSEIFGYKNIFTDNITYSSGGVFYLINNFKIIFEYSNFYNSTSYKEVYIKNYHNNNNNNDYNDM